MSLKKNNFTIFFFISSITLFLILNLFFYSFIKESEKNNINIEYLFSDELINYLKKEEDNYISFLIIANKTGFQVNEQMWIFGNDAKYMALYSLFNAIDLQDLFYEAAVVQTQFKILDNEVLQNLRFGKKNILKTQDKIILSYTFNNPNISEVFYNNQHLIKYFIDTNLFDIINSIFLDKIKIQENIINYTKINKKFCSSLKRLNDNSIEYPDLNLLHENFKNDIRAYKDSLKMYNSYCLQDNFNLEYGEINKPKIKKIISNNKFNIKFNKISKSNYLPFFILSFFISITFGLFVSMVIFKFKKTYHR